ncbi:hypothetical protein HER10_EVM0005598 [Colletotrichum scovillei]|uniref:Glycoside hydrolase family 131 protein n=1 Tax=Colletotrichum scovillei TaxID=1209932 RepID=A0A9P7RGA0_9PEZI|nr:uncharacterized protein HER10_EVM0005598 [Colletotrichum scovillei]KAF4773863.1 hypothetical protein HER10_EVM0005598 [Colletotrichum scovillei]KAG7056143.1 glycoside hydrolase family 131 protein [Colletotrichum scovillei]KAG7075586.1 glycoside hydrolase family 131 protein [Colletotrichum scovillei]KAG7082699.1 glycoside hydrolase family 131 protein [Colletotrichum scovillei]
MQYYKSFTLLSFASAAVAQQCTLQFDGRVATGTEAEAFDAENNLFSPQNVFGAGLSFSKVLQLPNEASSPFDGNDNVPLEVTISDQSIFNKQTAFRRAELIPSSNTGTDESTTGIKTLHFSLSKDVQRPLNLSHEYQLAFLESNDFGTNQVVLKTGTILGGDATVDPDTLQLFGNVNTKPAPPVLFSTPFAENTIHNFAVTMDFTANTVQVFYSTDNNDLEAQGEPQINDIKGQGQYHFGILKKPVGGQGDITKNGFQPDGIDEGIVYSGIFQEDSTNGCISLAP